MTSLAIWFVVVFAEIVGGACAAPRGPEGHTFEWLIGIESMVMALSMTAELAYNAGRKS